MSTVSPRKRAGVDPSNATDGPRTKRRKESSGPSPPLNDEGGENETITGIDAGVKENGLRMWNVVRAFRDKDGRQLATAFLQVPSRKQYPDYFVQIKKPVSLEEIKAKLDANGYPTLDNVKQDLETCFKNAKKYNMTGSLIWLDAKVLHTVVLSEYKSITGIEDNQDDEAGDDEESGDDDAHKGKKKGQGKGHQLLRTLKSRLQKLIKKTDNTNRLIAADFMELPNRKAYPQYYKQIKRPMCFDNIFKKIKRKEYSGVADFTADVELIFSNAFAFNEDHSPIWEDALTLKNHFKQIMADLPQDLTVENVGSGPSVKLKLSAPKDYSANGVAARMLSKDGTASQSQSPVPDIPPSGRPLESIKVYTLPLGRCIRLDHRDNVKMWSVRLMGGEKEKGLRVTDIQFLAEDSDSDTDTNVEADVDEGEEFKDVKREEEEEGAEQGPTQRNADRKNGHGLANVQHGARKSSHVPIENLYVKVNGATVKSNEAPSKPQPTPISRSWDVVELAPGATVIEVGERKGDSWRLYVDRI